MSFVDNFVEKYNDFSSNYCTKTQKEDERKNEIESTNLAPAAACVEPAESCAVTVPVEFVKAHDSVMPKVTQKKKDTLTYGVNYYQCKTGRNGRSVDDVLGECSYLMMAPITDWSMAFIEYNYDVNGKILLRKYRGDWYEYAHGIWEKKPVDDLYAEIAGFFQVAGFQYLEHGPIGSALLRNVEHNIDSEHVCHLPGSWEMPFLLATGENAGAWAVMENRIIQQEVIATALNKKTPIPSVAIQPLSPEIFTTTRRDYPFDQQAKCPRFMQYLDEVLPDKEQQEQLQMLTGLLLVPDMSYNVAFLLYGEGGTGKSVFLACLEELLGKDSCCSVPLGRLTERFDSAAMVGKLVNIVPDMAAMAISRKSEELEGTLKALTSGDIMRVEEKYKPVFSAHPTARVVIATNTLPRFTDPSNGIYDRIRIVAFDKVIRGTKKQDPHLVEELLKERPGILNWALEGLGKLRKHRLFPETRRGQELKDEMRQQCDPERTYLQDNTRSEFHAVLHRSELYNDYVLWCHREGIVPKGEGAFFESVRRVYPSSKSTRRRMGEKYLRVITGIALGATPLKAGDGEAAVAAVKSPITLVSRGISPEATDLIPAVRA